MCTKKDAADILNRLNDLAMSLVVLPRIDSSYLAEARWGGALLAAVVGVVLALVAVIGLGTMLGSF